MSRGEADWRLGSSHPHRFVHAVLPHTGLLAATRTGLARAGDELMSDQVTSDLEPRFLEVEFSHDLVHSFVRQLGVVAHLQ
jgi:hypothetical protein